MKLRQPLKGLAVPGMPFKHLLRCEEKNIILAGTLFYGNGDWKAIARASLGMEPNEQLSKKVWRDIELGESADLILQALCRGSARKSVNDGCGECEAWIIASDRSGIPGLLEDGYIFPGSRVVEWVPEEKELTGLVGEAFDFITGYFSRASERLPTSAVRAKLGMSRQDWHNDVLKHPDFQPRLETHGVVYVPAGGRNGSWLERKT